MRRIAIAGLGSIGRRHARLLAERPDVRLEAVEPNAEGLAAARREIPSLGAHASFEAMLETRPDVVWIATPHAMHAAQTIAALERGAHVFCEKPMSHSLADARRMRDAAGRARRVLNIGFHNHFHPAFRRLKELIASGALGTVMHVHARVGTYITLVNSVSRHQAALEGSLFLDYAHQPDLIFWMLGRAPAAVYTAGRQAGTLELSSNPNVVEIVAEFNDPVLASIHLNYVQMPERHYWEITGDEGWAHLDAIEGVLTLGRRKDSAVTRETGLAAPKDDLFRIQHQAFFDAVDGKRPPETSAADGLVSTAICDAAMRSWKEGRKVAVETT